MNLKNERGTIMLEAVFCIIMSIAVLMFMLSFGFFLYQKALVSIVANEVATEVAQTYKFRDVEENSDVLVDDVTSVGKYRYLFFASGFDTDNEAKGLAIASAHLSVTSLAQQDGTLSVSVVSVVDDIGRRHYEVTVSQKFSFLFGEMLSVIGQADSQVLEKTVYVESSDVLSYINTVRTTNYALNELTSDSSVLSYIDSCISLLHSIFDD